MICENCNKEHEGTYASGRFCSKSFSSKYKREIINKTVSKTLKEKYLKDESFRLKLS